MKLGALGDAGLLTTDDDALAERARRLRVHGAQPKYFQRELGGNFRMDALQAALLRVKLPHLSRWTAERRANAAIYDSLLGASRVVGWSDLPDSGALLLPRRRDPGHGVNQYVVRVRGAGRRDELRAHLRARGIGTEVYYPWPLHLQPYFASAVQLSLPVAEASALETLALPIFPGLRADELERVASAILEFIER
jgi:dTDP-4-amino-4,6-dideoxygalactose transaminase